MLNWDEDTSAARPATGTQGLPSRADVGSLAGVRPQMNATPSAQEAFVHDIEMSPVAASAAVSSAATTVASEDLVLDGPACVLRPGDAGFDECEACQ